MRLRPRRGDADALAVARVDWQTFMAQLDWRQGEHVSLIGPTGGGKTTLAKALLPMRNYVAVLATKPKDPTLERLRYDGYRRITKWPPPAMATRVLLWPPMRSVTDVDRQRVVFNDAMARIFAAGGWCVLADELRYLCDNLGLRNLFELFWLQGRSLNISLVVTTQRPAHVPVLVYDQATHLFFWRDNDEANLKRIGGIGWLNADAIRTTVAGLSLHDVLYVNSRTGRMAITRVH